MDAHCPLVSGRYCEASARGSSDGSVRSVAALGVTVHRSAHCCVGHSTRNRYRRRAHGAPPYRRRPQSTPVTGSGAGPAVAVGALAADLHARCRWINPRRPGPAGQAGTVSGFVRDNKRELGCGFYLCSFVLPFFHQPVLPFTASMLSNASAVLAANRLVYEPPHAKPGHFYIDGNHFPGLASRDYRLAVRGVTVPASPLSVVARVGPDGRLHHATLLDYPLEEFHSSPRTRDQVATAFRSHEREFYFIPIWGARVLLVLWCASAWRTLGVFASGHFLGAFVPAADGRLRLHSAHGMRRIRLQRWQRWLPLAVLAPALAGALLLGVWWWLDAPASMLQSLLTFAALVAALTLAHTVAVSATAPSAVARHLRSTPAQVPSRTALNGGSTAPSPLSHHAIQEIVKRSRSLRSPGSSPPAASPSAPVSALAGYSARSRLVAASNQGSFPIPPSPAKKRQ